VSDLKVVAIEDGLEDIGKYLSAMGYKTVAWGQTDSAVDAVVYTGKKLEDIYTSNAFTNAHSLDNKADELSYGILLINAQGKTPEQVYKIIKNRVYEDFI
jgi:hypothetical protein